MSPKSHQANLKSNLARRTKHNNLVSMPVDGSNKDLSGANFTQSDAFFLQNGSQSSQYSKRFFKRRPQTTKRIVSKPKNSHFNLQKDSSVISSV